MDREIFAREISSKRKRLEDLAQQIWENPEEPFQETIAARLVAELLEQEDSRWSAEPEVFQRRLGQSGDTEAR